MLEAPRGAGQRHQGPDEPPGRPRLLGRRGRLREVGRQAAADRGRVGVRRPRRAGRQDVRLGRRGRRTRAGSGGATSGRASSRWKNTLADGFAADRAGEVVPARTATGCTTWPGTCGSGAATGTGRTTTSTSPRRNPTGPGQQFRPDRTQNPLHAQARAARRVVPVQRRVLLAVQALRPRQGRRRYRQSHVGFRCVRTSEAISQATHP